jgi:hypothetical protein
MVVSNAGEPCSANCTPTGGLADSPPSSPANVLKPLPCLGASSCSRRSRLPVIVRKVFPRWCRRQNGSWLEPAAIIGEEPGEQDLVAAVSIEGCSDLLLECFARDESGSVGEFGRGVAVAEQTGQRHHHTDPDCAGPPHPASASRARAAAAFRRASATASRTAEQSSWSPPW